MGEGLGHWSTKTEWQHENEWQHGVLLMCALCCRPSATRHCAFGADYSLRPEPCAEWLVEGARLIARDRSTGRVAAAGYVSAVRPVLQASEPASS